MLTNTITGDAWKKAMKDRDEALAKRAEAEKTQKGPQRPRTGAELRQRAAEDGLELQMRRRNAQKLIAAGAVVTIGTDNYWAAAPEFTRGGTKPDTQNHGIGSVIADRRAGRTGDDAGAGDCRRRPGTARSRRAAWPSSARSRPASAPTCWCSTPIRWPTSATCGSCRLVMRDGTGRSIASACRPRACCHDEEARRRTAAAYAGHANRRQSSVQLPDDVVAEQVARLMAVCGVSAFMWLIGLLMDARGVPADDGRVTWPTIGIVLVDASGDRPLADLPGRCASRRAPRTKADAGLCADAAERGRHRLLETWVAGRDLNTRRRGRRGSRSSSCRRR